MQKQISDIEKELNTSYEIMTDDEILFTKFDFDCKQTIENRAILETRFKLAIFKSHKESALLIKDSKTGRTYGDLPNVALSAVWRKASRYLNYKRKALFVSFDIWEAARIKLEAAIRKKATNNEENPVFVQDVWQIHELDFIELGICHANEVVELMKLSVIEDIIETRKVELFWDDIRRHYPHRVKTAVNEGGIFSCNDSLRLSAAGISNLNDIRSQNIFRIKSLVPEHDFIDFPKQINRAYREDRAKRRDFRYRVFPFLLGFLMLVVLIAIGYNYKYTLLKNFEATTANIVFLSMWASAVLFIVFSAVRAVFRRKKKRPEYRYFTKRVTVTASLFGVLSLFTILSFTVFYERYDGYDDTLYYRNVSENEICIAGLVDENVEQLDIPQYIDGKEVIGIDLLAFYKDDFTSVKLNAEISEIAYGAFLKCENLKSIEFGESDLRKISKNTFKDCTNLEYIKLPATVERIESMAFKGCDALTSIVRDGSDIKISVGNEAFKNCASLESVGFLNHAVNIERAAFKNTALTEVNLSSIESMGRNAFAACNELESIQIPFIGKNFDDLKSATYIFGNKCAIENITITDCDSVYKGMFKGMDELVSVSFVQPVSKIAARAFSGCEDLVYVDLEGVTEIGNYAFNNCRKLNITELPESVMVIGKKAFRNCEGIKSLNIRGALEELGKGAFCGMNSCSSFEFNSAMLVDEIPDGLFKDCTSLTDTNILNLVTSIGNDAFRNCDSLSSVVLGAHIEKLGRRIFKDCDNLNTAVIAFSGADRNSLKPVKYLFGRNNNIKSLHIDEVDEVYGKMFRSMDELESVTFGDEVQYIKKGAFRNCKKLVKIDIEGVKEIGANAFRNCTSLVINEFPESIESVGKNAFRNCTSLTGIVFNKGLTSIGDYAFKGCTSLENADISQSAIDTIPRGLFEDCHMLTAVDTGYNISVVEARAFKNCRSLKTLNLMSAVNIGRNICKGCTNLSSVYMPFLGPDRDTPKAFNYAFRNSGVQYLEIEYMKSVPARAFRKIDSLVTVKINCEVEVIGSRAFERSSSLSTVEIKGVKVIKSRAFKGCEALTTLSAFNELEKIGTGVFSGCNKLTTLELSDNITHITRRMFKDCGFVEIILSPYTHTIDKYAFEDCLKLETIVIPSSVTKICKGAFKGCGSLEYIDLSSTAIKNIAPETFENCYALTEVRLPTTVKNIERRAFYNCDSLVNINLETVSEIEQRAFESCGALTYANLSNVKTIGRNAFMRCYELAEVNLSNTLEKIGRNAFRYCDALQALTIPNSVKKIGKRAFAECDNLTELSVPFVGSTRAIAFRFRYLVGWSSSVSVVRITDAKKISGRAFKNTNITEIYLNKEIKKIGEDAFDNCSRLCTVYMSRQQSEFSYLFDGYNVEIVYYD